MKTNIKSLTLSSLVVFCTLWGGVAQAATIDATVSWENVSYNDNIITNSNGTQTNYGQDRNYKGPRVDAIINPNNSQWRIYFRWNQNRTKGHINENTGALSRQRDYQRINLGIGYRYRFNDGWFEPRLTIRQDKSININGNNTTYDYYGMDLYYNYNINDRLVLNGRINPDILKTENNRNALSESDETKRQRHTRTTRFGWEIEQGLRYLITPNWNVELTYNEIRNRRDDDTSTNLWGDYSYTESNPQLRLYTTYRTSFGLTISPYIRKSVFGKMKVKTESTNTVEVRDITRYALRMQYQINNNFALVGEYYRENIDFSLENKSKVKQDYLRLGMRFTF